MALFCGCSGPLVKIGPVPPAEYFEAGPVTGEACGTLALGIFPVNLNERTERAYAQAVEKAHATSLKDTSITESWYPGLFGPQICTTVHGIALLRSPSGDATSPHAEFRENRRSEASDVPSQ
jgi:hypothetical protein